MLRIYTYIYIYIYISQCIYIYIYISHMYVYIYNLGSANLLCVSLSCSRNPETGRSDSDSHGTATSRHLWVSYRRITMYHLSCLRSHWKCPYFLEHLQMVHLQKLLISSLQCLKGMYDFFPKTRHENPMDKGNVRPNHQTHPTPTWLEHGTSSGLAIDFRCVWFCCTSKMLSTFSWVYTFVAWLFYMFLSCLGKSRLSVKKNDATHSGKSPSGTWCNKFCPVSCPGVVNSDCRNGPNRRKFHDSSRILDGNRLYLLKIYEKFPPIPIC